MALFGSGPSGRLLGNNVTVVYTCANKATNIVLPDLDPSQRWTAYEDGRPGQAVVFGAGGVGRVTYYQNRGPHTLTLVGTP